MNQSWRGLDRARDLGRRLVDWWRIFFVALVIVLAGLAGLFFYQTTQWRQAFELLQDDYVGLRQEHISLQNDTLTLQTYYDDVQEKYSRLKNEYADLQNLYLDLQRDMMELQNEIDDVFSLKKEIMLEKSKVLEILPEESVTLFYDEVFGYIDVNFTSTGEIYFWIGSSLIEEKYYSRYPPFPNTIFDGDFIVPVCDDIFIYINNPNSETVANIRLTIKLTY